MSSRTRFEPFPLPALPEAVWKGATRMKCNSARPDGQGSCLVVVKRNGICMARCFPRYTFLSDLAPRAAGGFQGTPGRRGLPRDGSTVSSASPAVIDSAQIAQISSPFMAHVQKGWICINIQVLWDGQVFCWMCIPIIQNDVWKNACIQRYDITLCRTVT